MAPAASRGLKLSHVLLALMVLGAFAMAFRFPLDTDMYWHLRVGQWQVENRAAIHADPFSFTFAGQPWPAHSWLSEVLLYGVYRGLGDAGLSLFVALLALGGLLFAAARIPGDPLIRAAAVLLGGAASAVFWSPRPQMVSYLFAGILFYLIRLALKEGVNRLYFLPPMMLAWVNLHGGWPIAYVIIALSFVGEGVQRLLVDRRSASPGDKLPLISAGMRSLLLYTLLSLPLLLVNPYGFEAVRIPFTTLGRDVVSQSYIVEWLSPDFQESATWPYLWIMLGTFAITTLSPRRLDWRDLLDCFGLAYAALLSRRNISLSALALVPVLIEHASAWADSIGFHPDWGGERSGRLSAAINWLLLGLITVGMLVKVAAAIDPIGLAEARADQSPVAAVEFLRQESPPGNLYNHYNWGGYLIWALPEYPVYIDGRADLYGGEMLAEFASLNIAAPGWESIFQRWQINTLLLYAGSPLDTAVTATTGWHEIYRDDQAVIFTREVPLG